jgi:hypothetical protein
MGFFSDLAEGLNMFSRCYKKISLIMLLSLVAGCLTYNEEVWLNRDGSGKMSMEIGLSEALLSMAPNKSELPFSEEKIEKDFSNKKGIRLTEHKIYSRAGNKYVITYFQFDSIESLKNLFADNKDHKSEFFDNFRIDNDKDGNVRFSRTIDLTEEKEGKEENEFGKGMASTIFSNYIWKYKIHFPYKIINANTSPENIDYKNNTVTWEFSMASFFNEPQIMTATLKPSSYLIAVLTISAITLLILIFVASRFLRRQKKTLPPQQ